MNVSASSCVGLCACVLGLQSWQELSFRERKWEKRKRIRTGCMSQVLSAHRSPNHFDYTYVNISRLPRDAQLQSKSHKQIVLFTSVQSSTLSDFHRGSCPNSFPTHPYAISPLLDFTLGHVWTWTLDTHALTALPPASLHHLITQYRAWVSSLSHTLNSNPSPSPTDSTSEMGPQSESSHHLHPTTLCQATITRLHWTPTVGS